MVVTRNQKRKLIESEDDSLLQINNDFTNISVIKRKKSNNSNVSETSSNDGDTINNNPTEEKEEYHSDSENDSDEYKFIETSSESNENYCRNAEQSESVCSEQTCTTDSSCESEQLELSSDSEELDVSCESQQLIENTENNGGNTNLQNILNIKFKPSQIQEIIKESIKQLVKKYNNNDMTFFDSPSTTTEYNSEYDKFINYIDDIHSGDFFQRIPLEDKKKQLKTAFKLEDIAAFNKELDDIKKMYLQEAPSIIDILNMNVHSTHKQKLLEKIHHYTNSEVLSSEYNSNLKYLLTNINKTQEPELFKLEQDIMKSAQSEELSDNYRKKILKSQMSFENKVIAYKKLEIMERYEDSDSSEFAKYKNWMDNLLSVPFGKYIKTPSIKDIPVEEAREYINDVRNTLDKRLSFLEKPKDQIINIVSQMIRNPEFSINAIGLFGCKGVGKTAIVKSIAEALGRPYRAITLGGESDSSLLTGHGFTYIGSNPGRLIEILNETKVMNPVVLIDELDKVSQTHHGKEIIGTLIHLTDSTTNNKYNYDRYFAGVEFDLSKVLFVFTYNDPTKVDRILADRLFKIKVDNYNFKEKLEITNKHLISNILSQYSFTNDDIKFTEEAVNYIIHHCKNDEGMRDIKRKFEIIISRINTLILTDPKSDIIKLKYKSLYNYYKTLPVSVQKEHLDTLLSDSSCNDIVTDAPPPHMYI